MKTSSRLLSVVGLWMALLIGSPAATLTWVGGTGDWSVPDNWDGGAVPGPNDVAVISSGDVTADWESTITGLTFTGGTLRGVGIIRITGTIDSSGGLNWTGGTMAGAGQTIVEAQGTGVITGPDKDLERRLENRGAITWDQGRIILRNGTLSNSGVMTITNDGELFNGAGSSVLENTGTLHKVGAGTVHITGVVFNQDGILDFAAGTLWLSCGGQNTKTIDVPIGGQLRIDGGFSQAAGSTLTGPGNVSFESGSQSILGAYSVGGVTSISGATVSFEAEATLSQLQLSNGRLQGAGLVHVTGTFAWTAGAMSGAGQTIVEAQGTGVITGPDKDLERRLENRGAITWDQGRIVFRSAGALINNGVMTIADGGELFNGGGSAIVENSGTLHKVGAGTVHFIGVVFNQAGILDFAAGTLWLSGGGQNTKTITVPADGQLRIDSDYLLAVGSTLTGPGKVSFENRTQSIQGAYTVSGVTSINGGTASFEAEATLSQLQLSNGRLQGAGLVHVLGSFVWTAGAISGAGQTIIESGATAQWSGGSDKDLERALENKGAITWDQGRIVFRSAGALTNSGVMTIAHDGELFNGGGSPVLENTGSLNKTSAGILSLLGVFFNQKGIVNAVGTIKPTAGQVEQHGTINPGLNIGALTWNGDLPQSADGTLRVEISGENNYDQINVTGNATLHGTLKVELAGGFVPVDGASFTVMQFASRTGAFDSIAGLNVSNELFLEPMFTTTNLVLTVHAKPRPMFSNSRVDKASRLPVFSISNIAGQTFILEARDSFGPGTAWQDVLTNPDSSVIYDFVDNDRANHPTRFFRVRLAQ